MQRGFLIEQAIKQQCLIVFDYHTPHTEVKNIWFLPKELKQGRVRGYIYDDKRMVLETEFFATYRVDALNQVRKYDAFKAELRSIESLPDMKELLKESLLALEYTRFERVEKRTFSDLFEAFKQGVKRSQPQDKIVCEKGLIGLVIKGTYFPFLSQEVVFNIQEGTFKTKSTYTLHQEIKAFDKTYDFSFLFPGEKDALTKAYETDKASLVSSMQKLLDEITVEDKSHYVIAHTPLSNDVNAHYQDMIKERSYVPFEALNGRLTLRNTKRKPFVLSFDDKIRDFRLYHALYNTFKSPITTLKLPYHFDASDLLKLINTHSIINDQSVLIVTPSKKETDSIIKQIESFRSYPFLVLDSSLDRTRCLDQSLLLKQPKLKGLKANSEEYETLFGHIYAQNGALDKMKKLEKIAESALRENQASAYIKASSSLQDFVMKTPFFCDFNAVNNAFLKQASVPVRAYLKGNGYERIMHPHLKEFRDLLKSEENGVEKDEKLLALLRDEYKASRIKNVVQLTVASAENVSKLHPKTRFDLVVFYQGDRLSLGEGIVPLNMARRVLIMDGNTGFKAKMNTKDHWPYYYDFSRFSFLKTLKSVDPHLAVHSLREEKKHKIKSKDKVHDINSFEDEVNHASGSMFEWTVAHLETRHDALALLTPFEAQKRNYKAHYKNNRNVRVDSLLSRKEYSQTVFVDTMIHKGLKQVTYDWMKNHPDILETIDLARGNIEVLVDFEALRKLSDMRDGLYQRLAALKQRTHMNMSYVLSVEDYYLDKMVTLASSKIKTFKKPPFIDASLLKSKGVKLCYGFYREKSLMHTLFCLVDASISSDVIERLQKQYKTQKIHVEFVSPGDEAQFNQLLKLYRQIFSV